MRRVMESHPVSIAVGHNEIDGDLTNSRDATAIVLFAHGSGSSRHSPRNKFVASVLNEAGIATLLMDLLTREEEAIDVRTAHLRFDIPLLAERLVTVTDWVRHFPATSRQHIGYFGASTGAAAALVAAAKRPDSVEAVVSRGGRPDLAGPWLLSVHAPTLLIVGENDEPVIELNRQAAMELQAEHRIEIVPGATHLFEETGTLEQVAALARDWFEDYLISMHRAGAA
ncbi:MAG: dienelactone hydrolase family protein [Acidobacteria bacterium]|nr:dienelactone hydrolase family protein [Acidobacteriota bacterium]